MLEHIGSGHVALHDDLKKANVQAWQQFTLAYPTSDNGAQYFTVANPTGASPTVAYGGITKYLRQYFKYIRSGAVRFDATSNNIGSFDPVAFRNTDGGDVVVVKASTGGSFSIVGLQAGTYGVQYTTSAEFATDLADVTVTGGGTLDTSIPAAGVLTVFPKPTMLTVVVTGSPTVGNITTIDIVADALPDGLSGFEMKVALANTAVADITTVTYNAGLSPVIAPTVPAGSVDLFAADVHGNFDNTSTNIVLATLTVTGTFKGTSSVDITIGGTLGVQDEVGETIASIVTTSGTLVVPNANPVVTAAADLAVYDLSPLNLTVGSFTDGDLGDTHTATIDWGDGSLVDSGTPAVGPISGMHSYATSSAYSVIVSVTDSDGGSGTATFNIVVQNFQFLPGGVGPARDINGDGKAEDVNGSGVIDFNDVVLLFQNLLGPPVQDNQGDFDFNGNGRIDFDDVVQLFLSFAP
ncbi:MAG: PKD domain-containing protein [Chloroflexi bacterium]|nr:PKD domain-containing protein [Chloroflexota bacterium]MDA1227270.1 PKD domain-containing protein [Chloroflexota bacterium]